MSCARSVIHRGSGRAGSDTRLPCWIAAALIIVWTFSGPGCRSGNFLPSGSSFGIEYGSAARHWTILVYLNGDNELEGQAVRSLNQLEAVDRRGTGVSVLVLFDRSPGFDTSNGDWTGTRLFEVGFDREGYNGTIVSRTVDSTELGLSSGMEKELDMGEPSTLRAFLDFAASSYPAEHRALILWGHGSGWRSIGLPAESTRAISFDDTSGGNPLYTQELAEALAGRSIDLCGFDCCSEAMIEVAYEIRSSVRCMVASEDVVASDGWDYSDLLTRFIASEMRVESLAQSIAESFAALQADTAYATISALRLDCVESVASALDELAVALSSEISDASTQAFLRSLLFHEVEGFFTIPGDLNLDLVDLASVASGAYPELRSLSEKLREAVTASLIAEWHHPSGHPRAHGLALHYVPLDADGTATVHDDAYFRNLPTEYPLSFVSDSKWVPCYPSGPGLLYRIWYEVF